MAKILVVDDEASIVYAIQLGARRAVEHFLRDFTNDV